MTPEEYTSNCSKLLTQIKLAFKLIKDEADAGSDSFPSIESFMERYKLDAKSALERIKDGRPITILDDKGNRKAMNCIAEIVSVSNLPGRVLKTKLNLILFRAVVHHRHGQTPFEVRCKRRAAG